VGLHSVTELECLCLVVRHCAIFLFALIVVHVVLSYHCHVSLFIIYVCFKVGEEEYKRQARIVRDHGAAVVVMAFDEEGQVLLYYNLCHYTPV
jgi:hypothetical protein